MIFVTGTTMWIIGHLATDCMSDGMVRRTTNRRVAAALFGGIGSGLVVYSLMTFASKVLP
jgi:hypothetical protein